MDAHALLTSQGWRGSGHSLHASSDSIGLARPLLVSQKQNTLGVGKKQHRTSDMWWMNAFDKSLQGLDTSKEGTVVQTVTGGGLDMVKKGGGKYVGTGGLYACFVRGETLVGSVKEVVEVEVDEKADRKAEKKAEKKRRKEGETKEERRKRKLEKRAKRSARSSANESSNTPSDEDSTSKESDAVETKAQRKERRRLKKAAKASKSEATSSQDSSDTPQRSSKDDKKKKKRKD
jgi:nucleolar protein TMA23